MRRSQPPEDRDQPLQARDDTTLTATAKRLLPWLVAVGFFMESLDTTILNTAVPAIAQALKVPPLSMKAVLASYTMSLAVFIPISGWMANRFGTRRVFSSAIGIFTLGSFLCGISSDIHVLVACRVLQGCGASMSDVVKCHVYLADGKDFAAMNEVYAEFFGDAKPARTTVAVEFAVPGIKVEIDAIAYKP